MLAFEGTLKRYRFALITSILFNVSLLLLVVPTLLGANEAPTDETSAENAPPTLSEVQTNSSNNSASNNQSGEEDLGTAVENLSPTPLPPTATLLPTSTPEPTATATPLPTNTPTPTATATSLPTDTPEPTPTVTPEPTPTVIPGPDWLRYINLFRVQAGVPPVVENTGWSAGSAAHSRYMLLTGQSVHAEERSSQFFTVEGNESGLNGNIAVSGWEDAPEIWPIDYWISALFHAVPMFDPRVSQMGYGIARDANSWMKMTGTLDIASRRGQDEVPAGVTYPITFPQDGGQTWILKYSLPEFPDPIVSCPGITRASGPPLFALLGTGDLVPHVTATEFRLNGEELPHCVIDETRYVNHENPYQQEQGRKILDKQDAVVILPAQPLQVGQTYEVLIEVNGETITWQFETVEPPEDF